MGGGHGVVAVEPKLPGAGRPVGAAVADLAIDTPVSAEGHILRPGARHVRPGQEHLASDIEVIGIDRRDIINDDLSLFDDTARSLGRSAMRAVSDLVYRVLLAGAGEFFSAGHGNYAVGADTALSLAALDAGITKMMSQRDDEGRDLDIRPKVLLVPPELTQTAKELLTSDFIQRANSDLPTGNALKNVVSLEVEPRLSNSLRFSGTSPKAWYLFAGPQDAAVIVAFLQGKQSPTVEFFGFDADPNVLAAHWRVYFDFGCALADYRAAYKAKGEA